MKWARFEHQGIIRYGQVQGEELLPVKGSPFQSWEEEGSTPIPLEQVRLLAPCEPTKAVCVGLNYRDHASEMKSDLPVAPLIFIKPSTCVLEPGGAIQYPPICANLHFEAELAIVIGRKARNVTQETALDYVLGYTCANDVTARDIQKSDGQWTRGKSFDTFLPLGPFIETEFDPAQAEIRLFLNGGIKQHSHTSNLVFPIPFLIAYITAVMTLLPGDVILTGTPAGVGSMHSGDVVTVEIAGIGRLENHVAGLGPVCRL